VNKRVEQFGALGQEDRLRIFRLLVRAGLEGKCVDEIKRTLKMPGSTLSHHLDTLTRSGLCTARRSGRFIYYAVNWRETSNLIRFLTEDCCADMHTQFVPLDAKARGTRQDGCCAENERAPQGIVRKVTKA
jgi:ArsR family transcriptional regulator